MQVAFIDTGVQQRVALQIERLAFVVCRRYAHVADEHGGKPYDSGCRTVEISVRVYRSKNGRSGRRRAHLRSSVRKTLVYRHPYSRCHCLQTLRLAWLYPVRSRRRRFKVVPED
jgi:hypothetical protein